MRFLGCIRVNALSSDRRDVPRRAASCHKPLDYLEDQQLHFAWTECRRSHTAVCGVKEKTLSPTGLLFYDTRLHQSQEIHSRFSMPRQRGFICRTTVRPCTSADICLCGCSLLENHFLILHLIIDEYLEKNTCCGMSLDVLLAFRVSVNLVIKSRDTEESNVNRPEYANQRRSGKRKDRIMFTTCHP